MTCMQMDTDRELAKPQEEGDLKIIDVRKVEGLEHKDGLERGMVNHSRRLKVESDEVITLRKRTSWLRCERRRKGRP